MAKKPTFTNEELKMPEEAFGSSGPLPQSSHFGIVLGALILILTTILIGLYVWAKTLQGNMALVEQIPESSRPTAEENNEPESTNAEADVQVLETQSTSDELGPIEADLESTNTETFEAEINAIDAELEE
jgi:cytoskeletal protein RodZ